MKNLAVTLTLLLCLGVAAVAQQKVVHFRKLQELLPTTALKDFKREKPTGNTQTVMGMSTSEAAVRFTKTVKEMQDVEGDDGKMKKEEVEVTHDITVKITDMSLMPFAAWAFAFQQQDYENETEDGYEKSTTVKKNYKGIEKVSTGDYKSCNLQFAVGNRFNVELQGSGFADVKLLYTLAEAMDLAKLERTEPEKK